MTRRDALKVLAAKVEAGDVLQAVETVDVFPMTPTGDVAWLHAYKSSQGSLDATKALHEAVLPGWIYNVAIDFAHVFPPHDNGDQEASTGEVCANPARAWLLAILRAMIAQEESA